ncbi:MAG: DUF4347 domain-containing protein, partial [Gammaproteobacteria bacterium]|nr:DUF4347 domain-containing protein [Gammaproteobacteria bacterium]
MGSKKKKQKSKKRSNPVIEALEPKLLFSADAFGAAVDGAGSVDPLQALLDESISNELLPRSDTDIQADESASPAPLLLDESEYQTILGSENRLRSELIFIDPATPDHQQLLEDLLSREDDYRQFEVVMLEADRDGVAQISDILAGFRELDAVHIISHGADGSLQLGSATLDQQGLTAAAGEIQSWAGSFNSSGDLLIYGCNLAASEAGQSFVDTLAQLTGADVAASDDLTGHASLGGDWELETQTGTIESSIAVSGEAQLEWQHLLSSNTLESYDPGFGSLAGNEVKSGQSWGQTFSYNSTEGTYSVDQIDVVLHRTDTVSGNIDVSLRSSWNGAVIGSATIAANSLSTSEAWYSFDIGSVVLNDNTTYYIQVDSSGSGKVFLDVHNGGSYSNGDLIDKDGNSQAGKDAAFRIVDISYPPQITSNGGGATANVNAAENQVAVTTVTSTDVDGDTPVYSISGSADAALFSIDSGSGVLTFKSAPDFESPGDVGANNIYDVQVQVSDGKGNTDTQDIAVTVTDVNDLPTAANNTVTTNEDTAHTF